MENVASRFGQRLAHTEKKYRDQALKKLTQYLTKRTEWSDLEWDKLWKALFYCMWMSDKRPVQEELSTNLASLVHKVPTVEDSLSFVESFFRTMHREWHGIDGLRLDKFYSLIRKFVHQTLLLLMNHEWETALVERFVSILSSEIMSQLPNGLRLHVTDLFLTELHGAAADSVDTETFLLLLEPFYTLMSSEYDKTVFKRVRELVFLPLLSEYKFGPQKPKKNKKKADDETDGEDDEEETKVFEHVALPAVQHRIFAIASADDTAERNRTILYELYSQFFRVTKVDSLKANQEAEKNPTKKVEKKRKQPEPEAEGEPATGEEEPKKKKNKKRRKNKKAEEGDDVAMEEKKEEEPVPEVATPEKKKAKKEVVEAKTPVNTPVKEETPTKKQKKAAKEEVIEEAVKEVTPVKKAKKDSKVKEEVKAKEEPVAVVEEVKASKKEKKEKKKSAEAVAEESTPVKKEKKEPKKVEEKPAKDANVVIRSGMKFRRCASCGGLGKGVVPVGKDLCGHCQRTGAKPKATPAKAKAEKAAPVKVKAEKAAAAVEEKAKPVKAKAEAAAKEEKPAKDANVVVRSGMKMRRCAGCGGVGKGLVPVGKDMCGHCQRTGQQKKKEQVATKKKRKAEELAAAVVEEDASAPSKKVTFGKNRALPHELSVKRLKASAKESAVKELSSDIKGVLKAGTTPPKAKKEKKDKKDKAGGRMKAADFF